ncbi:MAG: 23S rRNA pseudouridine2605 synthase, partial [Candidatus Azotimanducaceae bacterium]
MMNSKKPAGRRDSKFGKNPDESGQRQGKSRTSKVEKKNPNHDRHQDPDARSKDRRFAAENKRSSVAPKRDEREDSSSVKRQYDRFNFKKKRTQVQSGPTAQDKGLTRLNKYLAHAGVCSRREADQLIEAGLVEINGTVVTELGYKLEKTDIVKYGGSTLKSEPKQYILLNKPKDYLTTVDDPGKRKTVMELISGACKERLYPVGRLDRMTTGLLLFTNDGDLAKKLTHPSHGIRKVYHVVLDQKLSQKDLEAILGGVILDDGPAPVDSISYVKDAPKTEVGIELHIGRNRIVRRIFEHLGYSVSRLDRTTFAGLTKKGISRGQ